MTENITTETSRPPSRARFFQFNLGTILWLVVVVGVACVWWKDRQQLDARLTKIESLYANSRRPLWSTDDILGAPDDPTGGSGKSWCPALANTADWVEVTFDRSVNTASIEIHETYCLATVTKVTAIDSNGKETIVWFGIDPTTSAGGTRATVFSIPVKPTLNIRRVKIEVDSRLSSTLASTWACIDAVGLKDAKGKVEWASSASASTTYGGMSTTANRPKPSWFSW